jgi:catechol 2,3-dioxygenase-like lactoylglutathione lyase family enzyme
MDNSFYRSIDQVAVVVRDLDRTMKSYTEEFGIAPWAVYTFSPDWIPEMTFRGKEQPYIMKVAFAYVGDMMYELIESVQGPNIYEEWLNEHGEGLHHLGYYVDDIDAAIEEMEDKGYPVLQSGRGFGTDGDGAYAYFDVSARKHIIEAIKLAREFPDPERTFPE